MLKVAIVCESVTGNTLILAEALRTHLQSRKLPVIKPEFADSSEYDLYFVGSWTDKGDCGEKTAQFLSTLREKKVFLFGTCGFGLTETYFDTIYRRYASHLTRDNQIIGHFICQGKMPAEVLRRYEALKEANPDSTRWDESIKNFHMASNHPDRKDINRFCLAVDQALGLVQQD